MKIREVTSSTNPVVKVFRRALAEGTTRQGWLAVEGPRLLEEALDAPVFAGAVQLVYVVAG